MGCFRWPHQQVDFSVLRTEYCKLCPSASRRFYFPELAAPLVYVFITTFLLYGVGPPLPDDSAA